MSLLKTIFLALFFYLVVTPAAFIFRRTNKKLSEHFFKKRKAGYFWDRTSHYQKETFEGAVLTMRRILQRLRRFGFPRTAIFFLWVFSPPLLRKRIDRTVITLCRLLRIRHLKTRVNQTEVFIVPKSPWVIYRYFIVGRYDEEEMAAVRKYVPPGYFFIDVGANFGVWSFSLADHFEETLAFEPDPECFECLEKTKSHLRESSVSLFQVALSNENKEGILFLSRSNKGDGRIYDPADGSRLGSLPISLRTFDSLAREKALSLERIFLKLDVQGAEPRALRGMQNTLKKAKEVLLWMEIQDPLLKSAGEDVPRLFALLKELEFRPVELGKNFSEVGWDERLRQLKNKKDFCFRRLRPDP